MSVEPFVHPSSVRGAWCCRYVELEGAAARHVKATLVQQGPRSRYVLTEAALGGALSRHDLGIQQVAPCHDRHGAASCCAVIGVSPQRTEGIHHELARICPAR